MEKLQLNQALYPPENILSTKSIVLLSVPEVAEQSEWMILVDELQQFLAEEGIDAVAYINVQSLFSIPNKVLEIPEYLNQREIQNVILFAAKDEDTPVFFAVGPYNGKSSFFDKGSTFYARSATKLESITSELSTYFKTGSLYRDNLLVNESPEFFFPEVELGIVAKSIPPRLAEFKVSVEAMDLELFEQVGPPSFRYENLNNQEVFEQEMRDRNYSLEALVTDTTNKIFYKDPTKTNQALRQEGFQYELMFVSGTDSRVYDWLPFPDRPKTTGKIIHKFYLNDLRNNNIYVGKEWDASTAWHQALDSFLAQMDKVIQEKSN
ncbi:hypothetical protein BFP97_14595 [Roseivirga sp. 4D4]|uniref:hypothetical protein n=1 Tax=Roseivirga sp. 4D4 TaxID=1889784 RepID=UPI000852B950|nr:hypothetical protein [Roseivirga sp. 4D4]OEK02676.1 hypothetical protein BFP97_14595 [Roseivirga sp. 4D4]